MEVRGRSQVRVTVRVRARARVEARFRVRVMLETLETLGNVGECRLQDTFDSEINSNSNSNS